MRVDMYVSRETFADRLGAMREWLDRHRCTEVRFETAIENGAIRISIELPSHSVAEAFRRHFDPIRSAA